MKQYQDLQAAVLSQLEIRFPDAVFNLWFKDLVVEEIAGDTVTLSTTTSFKQNILSEHRIPVLSEIFSSLLGFPAKVVITVREEDLEKIKRQASEEEDRRVEEEQVRRQEEEERKRNEEITRNIEGSDIVSGFTFENFIIGDSNRFAYAACYAVAMSFTTDEEYLTNPLEEKYNPLFI